MAEGKVTKRSCAFCVHEDRDEFESMVNEVNSYHLDKKDSSSDPTIDPLLEMYKRRLKYPDQN